MDSINSITQVTSEGWGSRLGASIKGVIFGGILFLASFVVLFWNEGRAVHRAQDLEQGQSACVSVGIEKIEPANEGKLVHASGLATTTEEVADPQFEIKQVALRLRRTVEIYQWEEDSDRKTKKKFGGGTETVTEYTYKANWSSKVIDSSSFHSKNGHENSGTMLYESQSWSAPRVTMGAFNLTSAQVGSIDKWEPVALPADTLSKVSPEKSGSEREPQISGGNTIYFGANPGDPAIGDLRVQFEAVPPTNISLISQQAGESFQPWVTPGGRPLDELKVGTIGMEQFFMALKDENTMLTWILRLVGFLLMAFGLGMVGQPLAVLGDVLPFLGSMIGAGVALFAILGAGSLSLTTIGIAWLFYRPMLGIGLLAVALGLIFILKKVGSAKVAGSA